MGCRDQPEGGRHRHTGTVSGTVQRALRGAVTAVRRRDLRFIRPDTGHAEPALRIGWKTVLLTQQPSCTGQQGILLGLAQVTDTHTCGVALTACTPGGDDRLSAPTTEGDQCRLDPEAVDTVDHPVMIRRHQTVEVFGSHERLDRLHLAGRIDQTDPVPQRQHLGTAQLRVDRRQLAIDIGFRHMIEVDQGETTDRAARQSLDRPGPDPADTDHADAGSRECRQARATIQSPDSAKPSFKIQTSAPPLQADDVY